MIRLMCSGSSVIFGSWPNDVVWLSMAISVFSVLIIKLFRRFSANSSHHMLPPPLFSPFKVIRLPRLVFARLVGATSAKAASSAAPADLLRPILTRLRHRSRIKLDNGDYKYAALSSELRRLEKQDPQRWNHQGHVSLCARRPRTGRPHSGTEIIWRVHRCLWVAEPRQ